MKPWICPECRTVYAPWVDRCLCIRNIANANPTDSRDWVGNCETCGCPSWTHDNLGVCHRKGCGADCKSVEAKERIKSTSEHFTSDRRCVRCNHSDHAHLNVDGGSCLIAGCDCTQGLWAR